MSGVFLIIIATINIIVLTDIYRTWRKVRQGGSYDDKTLEQYLRNRGLLARIFRPMLKTVSHSWNMYPIGVLFGLGFDTASEVGILGMSATAGAGGNAGLVHSSASSTVRGWNVSRRHFGRRRDAGRIWMGIRSTCA